MWSLKKKDSPLATSASPLQFWNLESTIFVLLNTRIGWDGSWYYPTTKFVCRGWSCAHPCMRVEGKKASMQACATQIGEVRLLSSSTNTWDDMFYMMTNHSVLLNNEHDSRDREEGLHSGERESPSPSTFPIPTFEIWTGNLCDAQFSNLTWRQNLPVELGNFLTRKFRVEID